jgi:hypothetical protein
MPEPERVNQASVSQWPTSITLEPPGEPDESVIAPQTIWSQATKVKGANYLLFLAVYTSAIPATQEADGTQVPLNNQVLAWIVLGQHVPFNTADASGFPPPPRSAPCTFTGVSWQAWNATTGAQIADGGGAPSHPRPLNLHLVRWRAAAPSVTTVAVPDVIGQRAATAVAQLSAAGLDPKFIGTEDEFVIIENPAQGSEVVPHSVINLTTEDKP